MIKAASGSTVSCLHKSKKSFYCIYQNNFLVLPDGKTIVGPDGSSSTSNLVSEDITTNVSTRIGTLSNTILTVLYDPKTRSLFAGDANGHLHQYQRARDTDSFKLVKNYGDIGIRGLCSSCICGDLAFFGGFNTYCLRSVEISKKKLVEGTFKTAISNIYSLETFRVSESRVLVSVGGCNSSYTKSRSDVLELKSNVQDTTTQSQDRIQTHSVTSHQNPLPPNPSSNYSEKVLVDFMSQVLVYVQALFEDFAQKCQARYVAERGTNNY